MEATHNMEHFTIRAMEIGDWPAVARIYQQGMDSNIATFQIQCPSWQEWDAAHLNQYRLVAIREGAVVGWAALSRVSARSAYAGVAELSIYEDESARGIGIGKTLLNAEIVASEAAGFWTLQSGIMQNNAASIALHKSCGFRMIGYRERVAQDRYGTWRNTVLMERRSDKVGC